MRTPFRVWLVNTWLASKQKPVSRKLVASIITGAALYAIAYVGVRFGLHQTAAETAGESWLASTVGAFVSGWLTTELPGVVVDDTSDVVVFGNEPDPAVAPAPEPVPTAPVAPLWASEPSAPAPVSPEPVMAPAEALEPQEPAAPVRGEGPPEGPRTVIG